MPLDDPTLAAIAANLAGLRLDLALHLRVVRAVVAPLIAPQKSTVT